MIHPLYARPTRLLAELLLDQNSWNSRAKNILRNKNYTLILPYRVCANS